MNFWGFVFLAGLVVGGYFWIGAAALAAFFTVGSWPFLGVLALALALIWFAEANEEGGWAVVPFVVFCLFVHFVSQFNLLDWSRENLTYLAWRAGEYLAAGFGYALFRWLLHLNRKTKELDVLAAQFREDNPFDGPMEAADDGIRFKFAEFIKRRYQPDIKARHGYDPSQEGVVPLFGNNKYTFFRWFWWWPFSLVGWAVNDFIREVWDIIKQGLEGAANRLSALVFGNRANFVITNAQATANQREREEAARRGAAGTRRTQRQGGHLVADEGEVPEVS